MLPNSFILRGPQIYTGNSVLQDHAVWVEAGVIKSLLKADDPNLPKHLPQIDLPETAHLIPGMIDMHIHGAKGSDVMDATEEALQTISEALSEEGVTGYLATTMTESPARIEAALKAVAAYRQKPRSGAQILGVHLEGPFLSTQFPGAQQSTEICVPDVDLFDHWQALAGGAIAQVTLAPEQPGALNFIRHLKSKGVIASIGHTNATYAETVAAIEAGATQSTHLFNAMRPIHHREPGPVTAILLDPRVAAELILDGVHLHPGVVKLTLKMKGQSGVILVTDAMRAKCMGEGLFDLGGQAVHVRGQEARLDNGVLAGSVLTLNRALSYLLEHQLSSLEFAVAMVSTNPARQLGLKDRGYIQPGYRAEFTLLDERYQVLRENGLDDCSTAWT